MIRLQSGPARRPSRAGRRHDIIAARPAFDDEAVEGLKFSAALPRELALETLAARLTDPPAVRATLHAVIRDETCETSPHTLST